MAMSGGEKREVGEGREKRREIGNNLWCWRCCNEGNTRNERA